MTASIDISSPRSCTRCKGAGKYVRSWDAEGAEPHICASCDGAATFEGLDVVGLVELVMTGKKGSEKRSFRKAWPEKWNVWRNKDVKIRRAYYIWRMARFNGGADVTMPMTAMDATTGDPFTKELDAISDLVAKKVFGTHMAAAYRWRNALGGHVSVPAGLPETAYSNGPVADSNKPWWEAVEIR